MAEVVASMVVGPLLSMVKDKASSYLLDQYKVMAGMEEQHEILKRKLPAILDVITDAEQAATHREGAKAWLQALKKVAYQANEVFDEFKYEALRRQAKKNGHYIELGFHIVKLFPTHNRFVFRNRMGNKLRRIVQAIEVLVVEMNSLGFNFQKQASASKHWRLTDSIIVDPENIVSRSRDVEKQKIAERLIEQANTARLVVLPIVGIGGLGKTTLAQLIYNDPDIKKHFQQQSWVCVSDDFDVYDLARKICQSSEKDPEKLLKKFHKKLNGKRYLLVLDDVWNKDHDKWDKLKACLKSSGAGSAILVTTRNPAVAGLMGTIKSHDITALDDQFITEIIEKRAFGLPQNESRLAMVDKFVKRCAGSPLAAKALGSVLSNKTSVGEWEDVLNKTSICNEETGILPIIKLSYDDLPSEMKQCFAFCAVFPKDYEISVDKLIQLWIANGFIQEQKHPETIGKRIFDELASRSFFQDVKIIRVENSGCVTGHYWITTCKIHDLMHDVALSTMGKECAMASDETVQTDNERIAEEGSQIGWLPDTARHLFLSCSNPETVLNDSMKKRSPSIKTLLCDEDSKKSFQHLSKYSSLLALKLCTWRSSFPLEPKHMHHMRYLDLSGSAIRSLPEDLSIMYNLQTLDVSECDSLCQLPKQMKYMTALRHLYTHGCRDLSSMPRDLRKLISLQTLTSFVASTGSACSSIGELQKLNLGGLLELRQLENVTEKEAEAVNLSNKKELREVTLAWTVGNQMDPAHGDSKVLECLEPHAGLQAISIHSYRGTTFPSWMDTFQYMARLHLFCCTNVQYLCSGCPSLCFPNLKELTLKKLFNLERIWWEKDGSQSEEPIMFPELEKLLIGECGKLTGLPGQPTFPKLKNVSIEGCPKLRTVADSSKLEAVRFEGSEEEMFSWIARHVTSLTNVVLTSASEETTLLAEHSLRKLVDGKEKMNRDALPLVSMSLKGLRSGAVELCACCVHLQELVIVTCDALVHWPVKEFEIMVSLRKLEIRDCNSLIGYPESSSAAAPERSKHVLPRLEILDISWCRNLREVFNVPPSLRTMCIGPCDELESIQFRHGWQQGMVASSSEAYTPACLEYLTITFCHNLTEVSHLPMSLKNVSIDVCGALRSLEFLSGESPSLKCLSIDFCDALSSLTMGPQAYPCLEELTIKRCPAVKKLPACLQEGLDSIRLCSLDTHLKGAEKVIGWARSHYLSSSTDPSIKGDKLVIPRESLELAIRRLREQEASPKKLTENMKMLAKDEFERKFISAVVPPHEIGVKFEDIGALEDVKKTLDELVTLPMRRPELFSRGNLLRPCKGILLFGPPGTGKTLLAKALATEAGANFISITGSSLTSKWFGDAEKLTKALFSFASRLAPVIIFVDEVDSLLGARGGAMEHEATRRMRNEFMAAWDGLRSKENQRILILGATNRPFDLDDAVIRRLPRRIYVDLPDAQNRMKILKILLAKENLESEFGYDELANKTEGYSGSDLKNLCIAAAYRPVHELLEEEKKGAAGSTKTSLRSLKLDDFIQAKAKVSPSVSFDATSMNELRKWNEQYGEGGSRSKSPFGFGS